MLLAKYLHQIIDSPTKKHSITAMVKISAEVCQNHGGSRDTLKEMISAAAEAGADYVKMQTIYSEDVSFRERFEEGETLPDGTVKTIKRPQKDEVERLRKLDLTEDDHIFFIEECKRNNVIPFTTVFATHRIPFVASLPWPEKVIKVASYDCASLPMLSELCDNFDHLIISTGATFDEEIEKAAELVKSKNKKLTFLHCVTSYPNTMDMCNLSRMQCLNKFTDSVGWSDHTLVEKDGIKAAQAAIALGAEWIERHFTILNKDQTKDGPVSINPYLLRELRKFANLDKEDQLKIVREEVPEFEVMKGMPVRAMTPTELLNRNYYRGRFATNIDGEWKYNWEESPVASTA